MMRGIRNNRFRGALIGLVLTAGLCFSGFGFCLNHGHFCAGLIEYAGIDRICQAPSSYFETCGAEDSGDHGDCCHSTDDGRHSYRKGDLAVASLQPEDHKTAPPTHPAETGTGIYESDRILPMDAVTVCSYSTLLSLNSTVILA
ncbi:MAG: hypothetical protein R6U43_05635 [Candidatus Krumholzibacteriales bacterium]